MLERTAVQGQTADPSRALFRIGDLSRLWLIVQAPERDAVRVRTGSPVEITLAALPEQKLRGEIEWVGREVDPHSRTAPVRIAPCAGMAHGLGSELVNCRISKQFGADTVTVARGVRVAVEDLAKSMPSGVTVRVLCWS